LLAEIRTDVRIQRLSMCTVPPADAQSPVVRSCPTRGIRRQTLRAHGNVVGPRVIDRRTSLDGAMMLRRGGGCCQSGAEDDRNCKRDFCLDEHDLDFPDGSVARQQTRAVSVKLGTKVSNG
jgi:hypothetical protein